LDLPGICGERFRFYAARPSKLKRADEVEPTTHLNQPNGFGRKFLPEPSLRLAHEMLLFPSEGSGANGRIWPAMMSAELPEGWAWAS
jgi:hypothetical protein